MRKTKITRELIAKVRRAFLLRTGAELGEKLAVKYIKRLIAKQQAITEQYGGNG